MLNRLQVILLGLLITLMISSGGQPVSACVEGLNWGMTLDQVQAHLGESRPLTIDQPNRFIARDVLLDRLPVSRVTFDLDRASGLQGLAYEFAMDDMTEVLAGLRSRHGQPLSTDLENANQTQQIWVWNTGEDLITAIRSNNTDQQHFLISYRPSRLRPEML